MRNVVAGSASSALTPAARSRKPSMQAAERAEEDAEVLEQVDAGDAA